MKFVFYGTPEVAVPYLELLSRRGQVAAVITRQDKPAGRGLNLVPPPVKRAAERLGLRILQPSKPSEIAGELKSLSPDVAVCVAYGRLLRRDVLDVPRLGTLNVHFSLLPKYRGAAPAVWALVRGETRTGVSVFWLDEGMDTGPVFIKRETEIGPEEDAGELMGRLSALGLQALEEALSEIEAGRIRREPQEGEPSAAPLLKTEDARVDLSRPAREVHDLVRAMALGPRAFLELEVAGKRSRLLVLKTKLDTGAENRGGPAAAGNILAVDREGGVLLQCGLSSRLWVLLVQPDGKRPVAARDFLNGLRLKEGDILPTVHDKRSSDESTTGA